MARVTAQSGKAFMTALGNGTVGLVYYAGHGMMVNGENYLQPVDADFGSLEPKRNGVCGDHWHRRRAGSTTSCRSASAEKPLQGIDGLPHSVFPANPRRELSGSLRVTRLM